MVIEFIDENGNRTSGRKDTGRKDKYSDESPKKDFEDYRNDNPAKKEAREIEIKIDKKQAPYQYVGYKSTESKKQELISHIQSFQETFSNAENKVWKNKFKELYEALA